MFAALLGTLTPISMLKLCVYVCVCMMNAYKMNLAAYAHSTSSKCKQHFKMPKYATLKRAKKRENMNIKYQIIYTGYVVRHMDTWLPYTTQIHTHTHEQWETKQWWCFELSILHIILRICTVQAYVYVIVSFLLLFLLLLLLNVFCNLNKLQNHTLSCRFAAPLPSF